MVSSLLRRFLRLESSGGILLMIAAVAAVVCANLPGLAGLYQALLNLPVEIKLGGLELKKNVLLVVNDGLMAVFFLLVALEIKREALEGELSNLRRLALPGFAALGGIMLPAVIYAWMNGGDPVAMRGWAIPCATDIAFSLGVLALLGSRVPVSLKIFLTAVAVVDDLAAIAIIAVFYTEQLSPTALGLAAAGVVTLIILNRAGVRSIGAYLWVGAFLWLCVLKSGVHATLAGVALGFAMPLRVEKKANGEKEGEEAADSRHAHHHAPLRVLEHALHPWVAFGILPLFAFANAGVSLRGVSGEVFAGPVALGIAAGLLIGKTVGVFGTSWLAVKTGLGRLPEGTGWTAMFGVALLAGIGFTMSLFIGTLAFEGQDPLLGVATRVGVFAGSIASALCGAAVLRMALRPSPEGTEANVEKESF